MDLGPIMVVRHLLSERQWSSVGGTKDREQPVLARFEIVDAYKTGMPPSGHEAPVCVTAILYWTYLDANRPASRTAMLLVHVDAPPEGPHGYYNDGPRPVRARIETVEFTLQPEGLRRGKLADVKLPGATSVEFEEFGQDGWKMEGEKVVSSRTVEVPERNDVVPLYDPSVQKLPKGAIRFARPYETVLDPWGNR